MPDKWPDKPDGPGWFWVGSSPVTQPVIVRVFETSRGLMFNDTAHGGGRVQDLSRARWKRIPQEEFQDV